MVVVAACSIVALSPAAIADTPPPFPDFTFKRVKVPPPGTRKRITVQIRETRSVRPAARPRDADPPLPARPPRRFDGFWQTVPAGPGIAPSERLAKAIAALKVDGESGRKPRELHPLLQAIIGRYGPQIEAAALRSGLSAALILAVISVESAGRNSALSPRGAQGLMQLIPATAKRFGVEDAFDPARNIAGGAKYLDFLLRLFKGDILLALAGYNAGENAVIRAEGVPDYAETRAYVPLVLDAWLAARELCRTPQRSVRVPCSFRLRPESAPAIVAATRLGRPH